MASSFSAQVGAWAAKSEKRMEAVVKESAQRVALEVKRRTPVDTGFLRASLLASTNSMPLIDRNARPGSASLSDGASQIALVIAGAQLGQPIYLGFVASYAQHVEFGTRGRTGAGMVRLTAQSWDRIVRGVVAEAKLRIR